MQHDTRSGRTRELSGPRSRSSSPAFTSRGARLRRRIVTTCCCLNARAESPFTKRSRAREPLHTRHEVHHAAVGGQHTGCEQHAPHTLAGCRRASVGSGSESRTRTTNDLLMCSPVSPGSSSPGHPMVTARARNTSEQTWLRAFERSKICPFGAWRDLAVTLLPR